MENIRNEKQPLLLERNYSVDTRMDLSVSDYPFKGQRIHFRDLSTDALLITLSLIVNWRLTFL